MVCQLLHLAKHGPTVYVRAYASAFAVMALTSLTWIDAIKSGLPVRRTEVNGDTLDGVAFRQKSKAGPPMLWWCLVLDFFGESGWYVTLSEVLTKTPDWLLRRQFSCSCTVGGGLRPPPPPPTISPEPPLDEEGLDGE